MIPIAKPILGPDVEAEVIQVIRSGDLAQGVKVAELEEEFRQLTGCKHAVAVSSGTVALEMALSVLGLGPRDEALTTPFTFVATLNAIIHTGATATFVDIDENGLLDLESVLDRITPRTRVVLPVHLYGLPVDLLSVELPRSVIVVEDAAQAVGARIRDRSVGSFGLGCFSLYATKNVTTGEGGVITTNDTQLAEVIRLMRNQGMRRRYEYLMPGHNYRMTDLQAAVGLPQLRHLQEINEARRRNADRLIQGLSDIQGVLLPKTMADRTHVWHQFTIRITEEASIKREELAKRLHAKGIATGVYYPKLVFDYDCFRGDDRVRPRHLPNAARWASQVISLPVHPGVSEDDIKKVVAEVRSALGA